MRALRMLTRGSSFVARGQRMHFCKKPKCTCGILSWLLSFLRLLGGFPYTLGSVDEGKLEVKRSICALVWTPLVVGMFVALSLSSLANAPTRQSTTENWTTHIVNYIAYGAAAVIFLYLAVMSPKLASVLRNLIRNQADLRRPLLGSSDYIHLMCLLGIVAGVIYFTYCSVKDLTARLRGGSESVFYHIPVTILDPFIELVSITLGLLIYFILKLIGQETTDIVALLTKKSANTTPTSTDVQRTETLASETCPVPGVVLVAFEDPPPPVPSPPTSHSLRRLVALDEVVLEILEYGGPVLFLILLSAAFNATIMLFLSFRGSPFWSYYASYAGVKILLILHVACLPDFLLQSREKALRHVRREKVEETVEIKQVRGESLGEVERMLENAPQLSVCQLFTLERHLMLPMAASVLTFLFFTAQFGLYEDPHSTNSTCPPNPHPP